MRINPVFANVLGFVPHHSTRLELWELERIPLRPKISGNEIESNAENFDIKHLPDLPILKILSNLDWETLKNCRLVCSMWDRLVQEKYFNEKTICFTYPTVNYDTEYHNSIQAQVVELSTTFFRDARSKFSTLRCKGQKTYVYSFALYIPEILAYLLILKRELECVTRLEIISGDWSTNRNEGINLSLDPGFVQNIMASLNNVTVLIILEPEKYKDAISFENTNQLQWDLERYRRKSGEHYFVELRNLTEIHYSMNLEWWNEICSSLDFLLIGAKSCKQLVKLCIEIDYSTIWEDAGTLMNFYRLIGLILKNNAGSLKDVHIGTRNVFETDDVLMGERERWRWRYRYTTVKIEDLLESGNWAKEYFRFTRNEMFENFLNTIWLNNWKDFGMNVLEYLTLEFPLTVFPTEEIDSILVPFLQSLRSLKTVKIQPIFGQRNQDGSGYIPLPYFSDIFTNFDRDGSRCPIFVSDLVFFSETTDIDWTSLQGDSHRSTLDLVFKTKRGESKGQKSRSIHWRNVSWENLTFGNSIVVPHLRHLTRLVIHQNKHCPPDEILTLDDSEFQMILRDGKSLQRLILNCDLGNVTPFGYSGLPFDCLSFLRRFHGMYRERKAHSIRDLKGLSCLCLIGLKGHEPGWTRATNESELMNANFEFLQYYFSNSDQVKFLILGLDGLTRVRRIDKDGPEINYSYRNQD